nr:putative ribonuclease H-like domain-containing protein [Tanacetum cinerariifolium]
MCILAHRKDPSKGSECKDQEQEDNVNNTNNVNVAGTNRVNVVSKNISNELLFDPNMPTLDDISTFNFSSDHEDDDEKADMNNMDTTIQVSPTTRINKAHPLYQVIGDLHSTTKTRNMSKNLEEHRIEAIRLFLAYASFKDFVVYQMDVKSAFLYEKIKEEVYACQPPGFEDLNFLDKVYKVKKALYGLHQAPRAWLFTSDYLNTTQIHVDDLATKWLKRLAAYAKCNCDSYEKIFLLTLTLSGVHLDVGFGGLEFQFAYEISWKDLMKRMNEAYCPRNNIQKLEIELQNLTVKGTDVLGYIQRLQELDLLCPRMVPEDEDKVEMENHVQQPPFKRLNVARAYTVGPGKKSGYADQIAPMVNQRTLTCFECGKQGNCCSECPKLKNQNREIQVGSSKARGRVYALGGGKANQDPNVVTGMFLLNNHYAFILFDPGANKSFVPTAFSSLLDITPFELDTKYDVELAYGKIVGVDTII